jgi:putative nucleotidyltransferase with HDIG domain
MVQAALSIEPAAVPATVLEELTWRVQRGRVELPLLPGVAMEITEAAARDDADARMIAEILRRDQALAAHVLRVVASPAYSGSTRIVSLQQAVARLGLKKIREIALAIAFRVGVFELKGFDAELSAMFQHAVAAALFAQELARVTRRNVDDAFMCGLLHDVGRPVILQALVSICAEQRQRVPPAALLLATRELHAEVGGILADSWNLPDAIEMAIRHHHDLAGPDLHANAVRITALANALSHFLLEPCADGEAELRKHPALAPLEIYPDMLEKVLARGDAIKAVAGALS